MDPIFFTVCALDKKQTMRFHNPLPNRSISIRSEADSASLPPLDHTRAITGLSSAQPVKNSGCIAPPIKIQQQQQQQQQQGQEHRQRKKG